MLLFDIHRPLPRVCIYAADTRNIRGSATLISLRISLQVVVVIYFLQDNIYIHSFSSVLAVKLGQLSLSNNLKSGVEMCL